MHQNFNLRSESQLEDQKKHRVQLTKDQKRILAERSKEIAFAEEDRRRNDAQAKTARLRALREAQSERGNGG
jgi:hypothetical protein